MKNKKGIELSINFLVVIIISMAMLGMAIIFFNKFFAGAQRIQENYDKQTEQELEALLVAGHKVAIPFTRKEVVAGKTAVFGLGILSVSPDETEFYVEVECSKLIKEDGSTESCNLENDPLWTEMHVLRNNQNTKIPIAVSTVKDDERGTYVFNVCVCDGYSCGGCPPWDLEDLYDDNPHKLYLKVI